MYKDTETSQITDLHEIYQKVFGYKTDGFFVEVGAYDGYRWSNTVPLIKADWSGVMIEPIDKYYNSCVDRYKDNDKIEVYNCCIGWENNNKQKVYSGGPCSTVLEDVVEVYNQTNFHNLDTDVYIESVMYTLDTFLEDKRIEENFDVLCIDVEGAEWKILEVFNIDEWKPKMAIVETHEKHQNKLIQESGNSKLINEYFKHNNYQQIYVDEVNSIYIYE